MRDSQPATPNISITTPFTKRAVPRHRVDGPPPIIGPRNRKGRHHINKTGVTR